MEIELFTFSGTPFGWRVQLAAALKGIPLEVHWLKPTPEALRSDDYLRLNPRGKVPTLKHGEFVIYESAAIVSYLDSLTAEPPFFGHDAQTQARVRQVVSEIDCYLSPLLPTFAAPLFLGAVEEHRETVASAAEAILEELDRYERVIEGSTFLPLAEIFAGDIMLYPLVRVFLRAAAQPGAGPLGIPRQFEERYPALVRWSGALDALAATQATKPPGWT